VKTAFDDIKGQIVTGFLGAGLDNLKPPHEALG
ncbi:uncharacterized protein METZ01_LOCUS266273, partial [marine metagenome]